MDSNSRKKAKKSLETSEAKPFSRPWKSSDLVLKVADREFHVHRAVLILSSPVFEAMLSSNFKERSAKEIPLPGKDASELEQMLQGIYPDRDLRISKENCLALLKLSTEYQIDRLKTRCEEYLRCWCQEDLTVDEALEVIIVSQKYFLHEWIVKKCVDKFVSQVGQTWEKIQKHERYCELEKETVKRLTEERVNHLEKMLKIGANALTTPFGSSQSITGFNFAAPTPPASGGLNFAAQATNATAPAGFNFAPTATNNNLNSSGMFSFGGGQPQGNTMFTAGTGGENAGIAGRKFKKAVRRTKR